MIIEDPHKPSELERSHSNAGCSVSEHPLFTTCSAPAKAIILMACLHGMASLTKDHMVHDAHPLNYN